MLFSSFEFLFLFLPVTLAVWLLVPPRGRFLVLLAASLVFYAFGEPIFVLLLVGSALVHWLLGRLAERRAVGVWLAVAFDLLLLVFFKYYDRASTLFAFPALGLFLPLGISFYSFTLLSYVIDVRCGEPSERSFFRFAAYALAFPKLLSGPITRYGSVRGSLLAPRVTFDRAAHGIGRFVCGLSKKLLLAAPASEMWSYLRALEGGERGILGSWLALVFFSFWLYYDFSGYTDMALGVGEIFGLSLPENFDYPYTAESPRDFWRRWHITLSVWFRDYVYIPLGGNRRGAWRTLFNLLAVWLLTGLWHGSTLNFVIWGLYWFVLLGLERAFKGRISLPRALRRALMIPLILISWLIFAFEDLGEGASFLRTLAFGAPWTALSLYELARNAVLLPVLVLGATPLPKRLFEKRVGRLAKAFLCLFGFLLSLAYLAGGTHQPFLYLKF